MATATIISTKELQRVSELAYEGETLNVMLCSLGESGYTAESTVTEWESTELSGNGYQRFSMIIPAGSFNAATGRYEVPAIDAVFTATGLGYSYNRIVLFIEGSVYIHSLLQENPNITMMPGQSQTYRFSIVTED